MHLVPADGTPQPCWSLGYFDTALQQEIRLGLAYSTAEVTAFQFKCLRNGDIPRVKPYSALVRGER